MERRPELPNVEKHSARDRHRVLGTSERGLVPILACVGVG